MVNTQSTGQTSGISPRPHSHSFRTYAENQQQLDQKTGDVACLGFVMLIVGSIFIGEAVSSDYSVTVMLCVMGIVCGLIILVGSGILGRLFISRKWRIAHRHPVPRQPPHACFHTCSVVYTPSQDQLAQGVFMDPPPPYEAIILNQFQVYPQSGADSDSGDEANGESRVVRQVQAVMALPPKYAEAVAPIPPYGHQV
ncbi:hypothetical protein ScPMuIL_004173 [Solemya velum]